MASIADYVPPASWSDLDMSWSAPNAQQACYVDALRLATLERLLFLNGGSSSSFSDTQKALFNPANFPQPNRKLNYSLLPIIHSCAWGLVTSYINHTNPLADNFSTSGSFRLWTIRDIFDAIGDSSIIFPQAYAHDNSEWALQIYKLLNLLRTFKIYFSLHGILGSKEGRKSNDSGQDFTTWEEASWADGSYGILGSTHGRMESDTYKDGDYRFWHAYRYRATGIRLIPTNPLAIGKTVENLVVRVNPVDSYPVYCEAGMIPGQAAFTQGFHHITGLSYVFDSANQFDIGNLEEPPYPDPTSEYEGTTYQGCDFLVMTNALFAPDFKFKAW